MTKGEFKQILVSKYENVDNDRTDKDGFDVTSNHDQCFITFGVRILALTDDIIITFGGYGCHFQMIENPGEEFNFDKITDEFEEYFKKFEPSLEFKDMYFCNVEQL